MRTYEVQLVIGPIDEPTETHITDDLGMSIETQSGLTVAVGYVDGDNGALAILDLAEQLGRAGIVVERAVPELVNAAAIAERAGVSRQAVTKWTHNTGDDCFPRPWLVSAGRPMWEWQAVNEWLRSTGRACDDCAYPTQFEIGQANSDIAYSRTDPAPVGV